MRSIETMMAEGAVEADLQRLGVVREQKGELVPEQLYVHFKGGLYVLLTVAQYHDHKVDSPMVIYVSLKTGSKCSRFLAREGESSWNDRVPWPDGITRQRFEHVPHWARYYQLLHAARVTKDPLE